MPDVPVSPEGAAFLSGIRFRVWRRRWLFVRRRLQWQRLLCEWQLQWRRRWLLVRRRPGVFEWASADVSGNMFRVRTGHRSSISAAHGQAGLLPGVLPVAAHGSASPELQLLVPGGSNRRTSGVGQNVEVRMERAAIWPPSLHMVQTGRRSASHVRFPFHSFVAPRRFSHRPGVAPV